MNSTIETRDLHTLPPLPYAQGALEPVISATTISFHYGKHHRGYVDRRLPYESHEHRHAGPFGIRGGFRDPRGVDVHADSSRTELLRRQDCNAAIAAAQVVDDISARDGGEIQHPFGDGGGNELKMRWNLGKRLHLRGSLAALTEEFSDGCQGQSSNECRAVRRSYHALTRPPSAARDPRSL